MRSPSRYQLYEPANLAIERQTLFAKAKAPERPAGPVRPSFVEAVFSEFGDVITVCCPEVYRRQQQLPAESGPAENIT
jgi:hypothetical protein